MLTGKHLPAAAAIIAAAAGLAIFFLSPLSPPEANTALAIGVFVLTCWASSVWSEAVTTLIFFTLAMLTSLAPPSVVFSGFASSALWMVFAGLVLGVAMEHCALPQRLAEVLSYGIRGSYTRVIACVVGLGMMLAFVMPAAMGRIILLVPVVRALARQLGFPHHSLGGQGMVLAAALGTFLPAFAILPSNIPNIVFASVTEAVHSYTPSYGSYLLLHFPLLGLVKGGVIVALISWLHRQEPDPQGNLAKPAPVGHPRQRVMCILLLAVLSLWITDVWHQIPPAWVALSAAIICLLPGSALTPSNTLRDRIDFSPFFHTAGIVGFGSVVSSSGLGENIAQVAILPLQPAAEAFNFAVLVAGAAVMGMVATLPGVPIVLVPLAAIIAERADLPLESVLMTQIVGLSSAFFPYQLPPLVAAARLGGVSSSRCAHLCLLTGGITMLVIVPLDFLWWRLLKWI